MSVTLTPSFLQPFEINGRKTGPKDINDMASGGKTYTPPDFEVIRRARRFDRGGDKQGVIYFVGYGDGPVKIGFTTNLPFRLQSLQTACPYEMDLLAQRLGTPGDEWKYHERFRSAHIRGEWFKRTAALLKEVTRINTTLTRLSTPLQESAHG